MGSNKNTSRKQTIEYSSYTNWQNKKDELQLIYLVKELESQLDEINTNIDRAYQWSEKYVRKKKMSKY